MGPLHLADYIGLDTIHNILTGWIQVHPTEAAFFVPECLDKLVSEGKLGRKTGQGFYTWDGDKLKNI
jgi:3-hydroxyacyl-CoA dehydrogenase